MFSKSGRVLLVPFALMSLCAASAFAAPPTISAFTPASGALNSTVTITGTNFIAPVTVSFNGVSSSSVTVVSSTSVKATVPSTASTGAITLSASGGSATSTSAFTVLPGVVASTAVGPPTTALTVYYSGFGAREAVDVYFDTEDVALGTTSAGGVGNIPATVPADAHPGSHWITAVGRVSGSAIQIPFTVRASWPQFGFVPTHKGKNHYENVLSVASAADLDEAWRTPEIGDVESAPAVVNGIVYAAFDDGSIRAFNEITGVQQWSFVTTAGVTMYSSPAVSNGIVYAGSSDDHLYALNAATGTLKWSFAADGAILSSPNVVNGIVYFGSYDHNVYALNATTGVTVWNYPTDGIVFSSPMVANGVLYVGSNDSNFYALNAATGALIWLHTTGAPVQSSPVIVGGRVCVGSNDGNIYAFDAMSGAADWNFSAGGNPIIGSAAAVGGAIFFGGTNGTIYCLSSGGTLVWSTPLPTLVATCECPVCVANGVVYTSDQGNTYALDQQTGDLLTILPVGSTFGGPIAVDGAVFAGDDVDGVLARYTPNALESGYVAPRPDPMRLRPHPLR